MLEELASGEGPELLVLDWHMPDLLGVHVCRFESDETSAVFSVFLPREIEAPPCV
jgi:DNA-binding response OmpR family regulator